MALANVLRPSIKRTASGERRGSADGSTVRNSEAADAPRKTPEEVLHQVMLELLYPAVLGAVLFEGLKVWRIAVRSVGVFAGHASTFDHLLALKCALVALTVFFYSCDYAYIVLTRQFEVGFFWYDCAFLSGLYLTFVQMHLDESEIALAPESWAISSLFAAFFVGYGSWDFFELKRAKGISARNFYWKVIAWEVASFLAFIALTPVAVAYPHNELVAAMLTLVILFVTLWFFHLVREKRVAS